MRKFCRRKTLVGFLAVLGLRLLILFCLRRTTVAFIVAPQTRTPPTTWTPASSRAAAMKAFPISLHDEGRSRTKNYYQREHCRQRVELFAQTHGGSRGKRSAPSLSNKERELIEAIKRSNTTMQLDGILRTVDVDSGSGSDALTSPLLSHLSFAVASTALRRLTHISVSEMRKKKSVSPLSSEYDLLAIQEKRQFILSGLVENVGATVIVAYRSASENNQSFARKSNNTATTVSTRALADTLEALGMLARRSYSSKQKMQPIAKIVVELMSRGSNNEDEEKDLYWLGPTRLVRCLQAMSRLGLDPRSFKHTTNTKDDDHQNEIVLIDEGYQLRNSILQLLIRSDNLGELPARSLSYALEALASMLSSSSSQSSEIEHPLEWQLSKHCMRRLRKAKVRHYATNWDIIRALRAVERLSRISNYCHDNGNENNGIANGDGSQTQLADGKFRDGFAEEATTFGYTVIQGLLAQPKQELQSHKSGITSSSNNLSGNQMIDMLSAWATLRRVDSSLQDDLILINILPKLATSGALNAITFAQLEKLLSTLNRLQANSHPEIFASAGWKLLDLVLNDNNRHDASSLRPHSASLTPARIYEILRCTVLSYRKEESVMEPYLHATSILFTNSMFVASSTVQELANFLWFMSMARWHNPFVLRTLVRRMLDPEVVESCTPKLASRILGTFVSLLFSPDIQKTHDDSIEEDESPPIEDLNFLATDLFHEYGGHLLSSQLSPAEISSALYAYAKISYVRDMGIYDHLVSQIALLADDCTTRQLSQSLWSCGKMAMWEGAHDIGEDEAIEDGNTQDPPYLDNAKHLAYALASRAKDLSPIDVAQSIWSLGRLGVNDARTVCSLAYRAEEIADQLNSAEVANILWGLCKVRFNDQQVINTISNRITIDALRASPQEAANVLYALGSMRVQDEALFADLTDIMLEQIDRASAQAIANALWAHRAVKISPPQELLDRWAMQKVGIVGISTTNL